MTRNIVTIFFTNCHDIYSVIDIIYKARKNVYLLFFIHE